MGPEIPAMTTTRLLRRRGEGLFSPARHIADTDLHSNLFLRDNVKVATALLDIIAIASADPVGAVLLLAVDTGSHGILSLRAIILLRPLTLLGDAVDSSLLLVSEVLDLDSTR